MWENKGKHRTTLVFIASNHHNTSFGEFLFFFFFLTNFYMRIHSKLSTILYVHAVYSNYSIHDSGKPSIIAFSWFTASQYNVITGSAITNFGVCLVTQ